MAKDPITSVPLIKADMPAYEIVAERFKEIVSNGQVTNFGKYVREFEKDVSHYLGVPAISTSSGTLGLLLSLLAFDIKPGCQVAIPSFTFMATGQAVIRAGLTPVFIDVNDELTMDPEHLDQVLEDSPEIEAVIGVHVYGMPCRIKELEEVVKKHSQKKGKRIRMIYDAAHAFGSKYDNAHIGNFGDVEIFSLSVTKALAAVEGGIVASKDEDFIAKIKQMRNYGMGSNYNTQWPGLNGKMSEFHAIIGIENLKKLESILDMRKKAADYLIEKLLKETKFGWIDVPSHVRHTYKDVTILIPEGCEQKRSAIMEYLKKRGLDTRAYFFPSLHEQDYFKPYNTGSLPRTDILSRRVLTVPFFTTISTDEMDYLVENLTSAEKELL